MASALPFGLVYTVPASLLLGFILGGPWAFSTVVWVFVLTPLLDRVGGLRTEATEPGHWLFDGWLWLWPLVHGALLIAVLLRVTSGTVGVLESVGLVLSVGIVAGGGGINIAHELMHRTSAPARATAEGLMTLVTYPHFCVEHVLGHHRNVATPDDPASARRGEAVYPFLVRSVVGGARSAWKLEGQRVAKRPEQRWTWRDRRLRHPVLIVLLYAATGLAFGAMGVLILAAQSVVAVALLEVINYVEHYGLSRQQTGDGRYERVMPRHSWNSAHRITGWYLFNLPRHADHHYEAKRAYPELRHLDDSPQLPLGYATMVLVALVPPLWFRVMNPRVDRWNAASPDAVAAAA